MSFTTTRTTAANIVVSYLARPKSEILDFVKFQGRYNDAYLFKVANDNIIKFTHSYNFNKSEGDDIGTKITLEMVDLENVFENALFGNITELRYSQDALEKLRKESLDDLTARIKLKNQLIDFGNNLTSFRLSKNNNNLTTDISTAINNPTLAEQIISKLKEKGIYKKEVFTKGQQGAFNADFRETLTELSLSSVFDDFNLNSIDPSVLPTPYFYFYYGLGDDESNWTGPVAAQITNSKYNYSVENGKKSIELEFATTYNFPAFSKLALDKRGFTTTVPPKFRIAQVISPQVTPIYTILPLLPSIQQNISNFPLNFLDVKGLQLSIKNVITDYIRTVTTKDMNVMVLLPDLESLVSNVVRDYYNSFTIDDGTTFEVNQRKSNAYASFFIDLGFETQIVDSVKIKKLRGSSVNAPITRQQLDSYIGDEIVFDFSQSPVSYSDQEKMSEGAIEKKELGFGPAANDQIIALSLRKEAGESFKKPLERLISGITNKNSVTQMCLEIIDNLDFVKKFKEYLLSSSDSAVRAYGQTINENVPLVVFGDKFIIEKYLYGKKFYEIKQIIERRTRTSTKDLKEGLSFQDQVAKWATEAKDTDTYLHKFDKAMLTGNNFSYIINIASEYFLRINPLKDYVFDNSLYSFPQGDFELPQQTKANLQNALIPVFKSGVTESNILSLDLNINDFYFATLRSVWLQNDTLNLVTDSNAPVVTDAEIISGFDEYSVMLIKDVIANASLSPLSPQVNLENIFTILNDDVVFNYLSPAEKSEKLLKLINFLTQQISFNTGLNGKDIKIIVGSHLSVNPYIQYLNMFTRVVNNTFVGYMKTIPAFYLAGTANSMPPIALIIEETNTPPYERKNFITRSYNGLWSILGFKHTINSDEMFSEFWIVKDIKLEIPLALERKK